MASKDNAASKKIITDLAKGIRDVFKKYSRHNRERGWNTIKSGEGEKQIKKLIVDPNIALSGFERLTFKEWVQSRSNLSENIQK